MEARSNIFRLMGLSPTGDLGHYTFYTTKRRVVVVYDKAPPLRPATYRQIVRRNRWRRAAEAWQLMTTEQRTNWHRAARRAGLMVHGYNLFLFYFTTQRANYIETIERQTRIKLLPA
jgi:hypothetical protein